MLGRKTIFGVPTPRPSSIRKDPQSQPASQHRTAVHPLALAVHLAFAVSATAVSGWAPIANAQQSSTSGAQEGNVRHFDIPAGPLSVVLTQFSTEAGIFLVGATQLAQGKSSPGVQGELSVSAALSQLLAGTGIGYRFTGTDTVALTTVKGSGAKTLPALQVSGSAIKDGSADNVYRVENTSIGVLGSATLKNTPYSVNAFSRDFIDNRQARSLSDVAKYDASVSLSNDDKTSENNSFSIRGISPDGVTGQKVDGMNLRSRASDLPLEHIEQVDVLKGAGGFLYGFGAPGGVINYVLKRPTDELTRSVSMQLTDSGSLLLHGDIGGRFGNDEKFGYRVNLVGEKGEAYINDGDSERKSASIALDWKLAPELTWQVDGLYANRESYGGYWAIIPNSDASTTNWAIALPPAPIDGSKRLAPDWMLYESEHKTFGTDLLWGISENWDMKLSYRYSSNYRYLMNPGIFTDLAGNYSIKSWNYNNLFESSQAQGVVSGEFDTGSIKHNITVGLSHTRTAASNSDDLGEGLAILNVGNLSRPVDFPKSINTLNKSDAEYSEYSKVIRKEIFLSDTAHFGNSWDFILGARFGNIEDEYGDYEKNAVTPTLAVIYRPVLWASVYVSYIEAFEQGNVAPSSVANAGKVFDPMISKQYETGLKVERDSWSANVALFQLNKGITYTDSRNVFHQDDGALYEGVEVSGSGYIGNHWMFGASAMWLDAKDREGDDIAGVAHEQYRLFGEFYVPQSEWVLTGGVGYTGERPLVSSGEFEVNSVTLFDLGARYQLTVKDVPVTLRAGIENLTDKAFWVTQPGAGRITQGAPRTAKIGVQVGF